MTKRSLSFSLPQALSSSHHLSLSLSLPRVLSRSRNKEGSENQCSKNESSKMGSKGSTKERSPASLDFLSPEFDALGALHTQGLLPPNPRVRPLDNLERCRRILPQEVPHALVNIQPKAPRSLESIIAQERAKARTSLVLRKAAERARQVKVFDAIAEKLKTGPLSLLTECYKQRRRVQVWTRHTHGVRGSLTGFIVAFDKHLNMVLQDVDEEYSVRRRITRLINKRGRTCSLQTDLALLNENLGNLVDLPQDLGTPFIGQEVDEATAHLKELRLFPKLEHRRRHLNQVFLRGDSVVMVQNLP